MITPEEIEILNTMRRGAGVPEIPVELVPEFEPIRMESGEPIQPLE